jgi:hypothetical protein
MHQLVVRVVQGVLRTAKHGSAWMRLEIAQPITLRE